MKVIFCKVCKAIRQQPDGTYVLDGIWSGITPSKYPCELPPTEVAIEFEAEIEDIPGKTTWGMKFVDEDGNELWEMEADLFLDPSEDGIPARHWCAVQIQSNPVIPKPGIYRFDVLHKGIPVGGERLLFRK